MSVLKDDHERLGFLLANTTEGWWEWDVKKNQTYHSPLWFEMLGYQAQALNSSVETWLSLVHPDERDLVFDEQDKLMQERDRWTMEFRMRHKDGHYLHILSRGQVLERDKNGKPLKVAGLHLDVTQMRKLQDVNQKQKNLLNGIFKVRNSSFDIYDILNQEVVFSTDYSEGFYSISKEELQGQKLSRLAVKYVHPHDRRTLVRHFKRLETAGASEVLHCTFRIQNQEGGYNWLALKNTILEQDPTNEVLYAIGSIMDITSSKNLEDKMLRQVMLMTRISFKNHHELRAPVCTLLGLLNLMKEEKHVDTSQLLHYFELSIRKLDEVISSYARWIDDNLR